jgi:hypothetical protein
MAYWPDGNANKRVFVTKLNDREEYISKLCSKFVHSSSLTITAPSSTTSDTGFKKVFGVEVLRFGWGILTMFHRIEWTK